MVTVTAAYRGGVLRPTTRLRLPDGAKVELQVSGMTDADPKDALMDDAETLRTLYAEFADEDQGLAEAGLGHYARMLKQEEESA